MFIRTGGNTAIFTILCILFLFEGEKILRGIFNMKSQANSIGDLAASGAIMMGIAKNTGKAFKRGSSDGGSEDDKKAVDDASKRNKNRRNKSKEDATAAAAAADEKPEGDNTSHGEYRGEEKEPEGVGSPKFDGQKAKDAVLASAMKRRLKKGALTRGVNLGAGVIGATTLAARGMAEGKGIEGALGGIAAGKSLGQTLAAPLAYGTNKLEQLHRGNQIAKAIEKGAFASEAGFGPPSNGAAADLMNSADYENKFDGQQEIYRKALAEYAKVAARGGSVKAEIAYYDYLEKNLKNN